MKDQRGRHSLVIAGEVACFWMGFRGAIRGRSVALLLVYLEPFRGHSQEITVVDIIWKVAYQYAIYFTYSMYSYFSGFVIFNNGLYVWFNAEDADVFWVSLRNDRRWSTNTSLWRPACDKNVSYSMYWHGWGQFSSHLRAFLDDLNLSANLTKSLQMSHHYTWNQSTKIAA